MRRSDKEKRDKNDYEHQVPALPEQVDALLKKGRIVLSLNPERLFMIRGHRTYNFSGEGEGSFRAVTGPTAEFPSGSFLNLIQDSLILIPTK